MRRVTIAAIACVVVAIAGGLGWITLSQPEDSGAGPAVRWVDRPPPVAPEPTYAPQASAAKCRAEQLQGSVDSSAGVGILFGYVRLTNIGSTACDIQGTPTLSGLRPGEPPESIRLWMGDPAFLGLDPVRMRAIDLPPGGAATMRLTVPKYALVNTGNPCSALDPDRPKPYDGLLVGLPSGGTVELAGSVDLIQCLPGASIMTPGFLVEGYDRPLSGPLGLLDVSIEAPLSVKTGSRLDFVVVMRNDTAEPISLDPCPGYQASLDLGRWTEHHRLNCDDLDRIEPWSTARFAMRIPVDGGPRSSTLSWRFDTPGWRSVAVDIEVR